MVPLTYPAPTLPAAGGTFTDPIFHSTLIRVTDRVNAPTGVSMFSDAEDMQWNCDGTLFLLYHNDTGTHLYGFNRTTYALTDYGALGTAIFDGAQWHPTESGTLFASDTARTVYKWTGLPVNPGQTPSAVHDFSAQIPGTGGSSSRIGLSDTGRYVMMTGSSLTGLAQDNYDYISIWDIQGSSVARTLYLPDAFKTGPMQTQEAVRNGTVGSGLNNTTNPVTFTMSSTPSAWTDPATVADRYYILCGTECMQVTDVTGTSVTVNRGQFGTTIASHANGAAIAQHYMYLHSSDWVPGDTYVRLGGVTNSFGSVFYNWSANTVSTYLTSDGSNFAAHKSFGPNLVYNPAVGGGGPGGDTWLTRSCATPTSYSTLFTYPLKNSQHTFAWDSHASRVLPSGQFSDDPQNSIPDAANAGITFVLHSGSIWKKTAWSTLPGVSDPQNVPPDTGWYSATAVEPTVLTLVGAIPTGSGQFYYDSAADTLYTWLPGNADPNSAYAISFFPWLPVLNEILINRPNGDGTWRTQRLCHHRAAHFGTPHDDFRYYPLAHPDPQARFVLFQSTYGNIANVDDAFIVDGGA